MQGQQATQKAAETTESAKEKTKETASATGEKAQELKEKGKETVSNCALFPDFVLVRLGATLMRAPHS